MLRLRQNVTFVVLAVLLTCMSLWADPAPLNGVSYVLLPKDLTLIHGVYRMNDYLGNVLNPELPLFNLDVFGGKVSGLAANQSCQVYLLCGPVSANWASAPVGWLPTDMEFEENSPIYLKVVLPADYGKWIAVHNTTYWKSNFVINGQTYTYALVAGGPTSHKYLDGISGTLGIPLWDGIAGISHKKLVNKWILPSNWGAVAYYAYGTNNGPQWLAGRALDGSEDPVGSGKFRPLLTAYDVPTYHGPSGWQKNAQSFSCVVKRSYDLRDKNLDLWAANDYNPLGGPFCQTTGVLNTIDLKVKEDFGRCCGDNCIPGGPMEGADICQRLSSVQVVTSTRGIRYGFNSDGKKRGPYTDPRKAALRAVLSSGETVTVNLLQADETFDPAVIANAGYLNAKGVTSKDIKCLGVSSKFDKSQLDYVYGSKADKFAVQDSWWGLGGIAYEYYKDTGQIYKIDYLNNNNATVPAELLGVVSGNVNSIGVDGDGFLYILRSETDSSDNEMANLTLSPLDPVSHPDLYEVGQWMRLTGTGTPTLANPPLVAGDYSIVKIRQNINKTVKRYAPTTGGSFGTEENRGSVKSGFDIWERKRVLGTDLKPAWDTGAWSQEAAGDRDSLIEGELAVVNLAKRPEIYNMNPPEPTVCRLDQLPMSTTIAEDSKMAFKVEGFLPFIKDNDGTNKQRSLKSVGSFGAYDNARINLIPSATGEYIHDEDGDGYKSGFPSSLFESSAWKTEIKWYVDWIEGEDPDKVLAPIDVATPSTDMEWRTFQATFPHPGNYAVYGEISYKYFDYNNLGPGSRPADLKEVGPITIKTKKSIVHVVSPTSTNAPDSHISNVILLPGRGKIPSAFQNVQPVSNAGYDLPEDESPTGLSFSFEAQFARDANMKTGNISEAMKTYSGVGVWDYNYYTTLYEKAKYNIGITKTDQHVYNCRNNDGETDLTIFNPGWNKPDDAAKKAQYGSRVDISPDDITSKDLDFITWQLFIYPTWTQPPIPTYKLSDRGVAIPLAYGTCHGAVCVPVGNPTDRKYQITVNVPSIATFVTPIDPEQYRVRLEIIYPSVKWYESKLSDQGFQYRSMIADDPPIHVVTTVGPHPNFAVVTKGEDCFTGKIDSWLIRARDSQMPTISQSDLNLVHTTGDPVPQALTKFYISDNNPVADFRTGCSIEYQMVKDKQYFRDTTQSNIATFPTATQKVDPKEMPSTPDFWSNEFKLTATYAVDITDYGPTGSFAPGLELQNWIGTLSYFVKGSLTDGYGTGSTVIVTHNFNHPPGNANDIDTLACALQRYDNDPPSLHIDIISQSDNRRWTADLIESINDLECNTKDVAKLKPCTFNIVSYRLDKDDTAAVATQTCDTVPACSNFPMPLGLENTVVNVASLTGITPDVLPKVRRSSRLMININIDDNVDYMDLASASLSVVEFKTDGSVQNLLAESVPAIPLQKSYMIDNFTNPAVGRPRARFTVDMPMKVSPMTYQVMITLTGQDHAGNARGMIIPVSIVDSTFDARVLESKEERK